MSTLTYRGLSIAILHTLAYDKQQVVDSGNTYLYTRFYWKVHGVLSPGATSYDANLNAPNTLAQGLYGAQTDVNIRHTLMQPRGQLVYAVGGVTVVSVPLGGGVCDANNGPNPIGFRVVAVTGDRAFLVEFEIECWVNECPPKSAGSGKVVLSHRWAATETMTRQGQYLATRVIQGHIVCRADTMLAQNLAPDDFRAALFFPVYPNMQRETIDVTAEEDGLSATYTVVDLERQFNLIAQVPGLVDMEIDHAAEVTRVGGDEMMTRLAGPMIGTAFHVANILAWSRAGASNSIGTPVALATSALSGAMQAGLDLWDMMPRVVHTVDVRVWGNRNATRMNLRRLATAVAVSRVAVVGGPAATAWFCNTEREQDEFVQVQMKVKQGFPGTIFANPAVILNLAQGNVVGALLGALNNSFQLNTNLLADTEEIPGVLTKQAGVNPVPSGPGADASRGTQFGRLVAQSLQAACALPAAPPAYQQAATVALR